MGLPHERMPRGDSLEAFLLVCLRTGVFLVLLTPLVFTSGTAYPFVVGKAVYARSLIAVLFVLWVVLVLARPALRPPRSPVLLVLSAVAGVAVLCAWLGVSPGRSLWSTYPRLQGVIENVYWLAFALVLTALVRSERDVRLLANASLAVASPVALIAIARYHELAVPLVGGLPEGQFPRVGATLGHSTALGGYMLVNVFFAAGLLARSFLADGPPAGAERRRPPVRRRRGSRSRGLVRILQGLAMLLAAWALSLSGSMAAFAGVAAGTAFTLVVCALAVRVRSRRVLFLAALAVVVISAVALPAASFLGPSGASNQMQPLSGNPLVSRITSAQRIRSTLGKRLANWRAGIRGFADKPLLGWGPENYFAAHGRHTTGLGPRSRHRDRAHSQIIEEAVTKGLAGLLTYLALWGCVLLVIVRAARRSRLADLPLVVLTGGALFGYFVQQQALFPTIVSSLQHTVLLAFVICFERSLRTGRSGGSRAATLAAPELRRCRPGSSVGSHSAGSPVPRRAGVAPLSSRLAQGRRGRRRARGVRWGARFELVHPRRRRRALRCGGRGAVHALPRALSRACAEPRPAGRSVPARRARGLSPCSVPRPCEIRPAAPLLE